MSTLFDFAVALTRAEAAPILDRVASKQDVMTDEDFAKWHAHWKASTKAIATIRDEQTLAEVDADELACLDRAAARAINNGFN